MKKNIAKCNQLNIPLITNHRTDTIASPIQTLQWRHNKRDGVSNHRRLDCSLNRSDRRKQVSSALLTFVREIHRWLVDSPHKRPVMGKKFSFDDVIINHAEKTSGLIFHISAYAYSTFHELASIILMQGLSVIRLSIHLHLMGRKDIGVLFATGPYIAILERIVKGYINLRFENVGFFGGRRPHK